MPTQALDCVANKQDHSLSQYLAQLQCSGTNTKPNQFAQAPQVCCYISSLSLCSASASSLFTAFTTRPHHLSGSPSLSRGCIRAHEQQLMTTFQLCMHETCSKSTLRLSSLGRAQSSLLLFSCDPCSFRQKRMSPLLALLTIVMKHE